MNVIRARQEERERKIGQIQESIKKAKEAGKTITFKQVVLAACANLNLSKRTASEYAEIALFNLGLEKNAI